jgi:hypothetical protein
MKTCSKCKIEKNNDEYYTYYHSKYDRHFTRRVCTKCYLKQVLEYQKKKNEYKLHLKDERKEMIELLTEQNKVQPVVQELIVEDFSNNPDYKKCLMCEKYKPLTDFYKNSNTLYYHTRCKRCHIDYSNKKQHDYYQKKYETCGGSERVLPKVGHFMDKFQEEQTRWLMELLGWTKENNVWVKEGIKKVVDGKIVWDKIPKKERVFTIRKTRTVITEDDIKDIVKLRSDGLLMREIGMIYNCSKTLIGKILLKYNQNNNNS